jgi:hypothetical protein
MIIKFVCCIALIDFPILVIAFSFVQDVKSCTSAPVWNTAASSNFYNIAAILAQNGVVFEQQFVADRSGSISFETEWDEFAKACGVNNVDAEAAWHIFGPVINASYDDEKGFSRELFQALKDAIGNESVQSPPMTEPAWGSETAFALKGRRIGFAREVSRSRFGFDPKYGVSRSSTFDHACIVRVP